jgi:hypothetical protein
VNGNRPRVGRYERRRLEPSVEAMTVHLGFDTRQDFFPKVHISDRLEHAFGKSSLYRNGSNHRESARKLCNRVVYRGISTVFSTGVENSGDSPNEHV